MQFLKKIAYSLPFLTIIVFSFYLFAPVCANTLNSDHAVHILMSNHVFFPGDLYYWGQDRLGSLLPILTNLFLKVVPVKSITAITIVEFTLLFISFYLLQTFLKNYLSKIVLCLLLFIPFPAMTPQVYVGHPYVSQFFIISLIFYLYSNYCALSAEKKIKKWIFWFFISVLLFMMVWISDLSLVFVLVFVLTAFLQAFIKANEHGFKSIFTTRRLIDFFIHAALLLLVFIPGMKAIFSLKSTCYQQPGYSELVNFKTFRKAYSGIYHFFIKSFKFNIGDTHVSLFHLMVLCVCLILMFVIIKKIKDRKIKFQFHFIVFFFTFLLGYAATLLSNWAFLNAYGARYFIFCYLFLMFLIVFYTDSLSKKLTNTLQVLLILGIGAYTIRTYEVQKITCIENGTNHSLAGIQKMKVFENAGIIADYWFSYITCIDSDMNVVATPREGTYVRNPALIDSVYKREKIILIKNIWLDAFPDSIQQFNRILYRAGNVQSLNNFDFCEYSLHK